MNERLQAAIDQHICREVLKGQTITSCDDLAVGAEIREFDVKVGPGWNDVEHIAAATVEQRHLDAVAAFRENYPLRWGAEQEITFRIAPAAQ